MFPALKFEDWTFHALKIYKIKKMATSGPTYMLVGLQITNNCKLSGVLGYQSSNLANFTILIFVFQMAPKKWSKNTFGWARAEVLGALVNAVFLVALCFSIIVESVKR